MVFNDLFMRACVDAKKQWSENRPPRAPTVTGQEDERRSAQETT